MWAPSAGLEAVHRSRTFSATLTNVIGAIKAKEAEARGGSRYARLEQENRDLMRKILEHVSDDAREYLDEFLRKHPF
jgi:hypothetical protein